MMNPPQLFNLCKFDFDKCGCFTSLTANHVSRSKVCCFHFLHFSFPTLNCVSPLPQASHSSKSKICYTEGGLIGHVIRRMIRTMAKRWTVWSHLANRGEMATSRYVPSTTCGSDPQLISPHKPCRDDDSLRSESLSAVF